MNRVYAIQDEKGVWQSEEHLVKEAFVGFLQGIAG